MKLKSIEYSQFDGRPEEWKLEGCTLGDINLIVGKNATGKSKTLSIISALAKLLSVVKKIPYGYGNFRVVFDDEGKKVLYILHYEKNKVVTEKLTIDSEVLLDRGSEGKGEIYTNEVKKKLAFQIPEDEVAVMAKRDKVQHPFFENIYNWGDNLIYFLFGTALGKDQVAIFIKKDEEIEREIDLRDTNQVASVFKRGQEKFKDTFVESIKKDMALIGYQVNEVKIETPKSITFQGGLPVEPMGLSVKEADLNSYTDQFDMSQGMFRALSVIIQVNLYENEK